MTCVRAGRLERDGQTGHSFPAMVRTLESSPWLAPLVESVHCVVPLSGRSRRVDRLPDGRTTLVLRTFGHEHGDVHLVGPRTRALLKDATGFERAVALHFTPGWSTALFGPPAHELTDRHIELEDVWGASARDLVHELVRASDVPALVERLWRAFAIARQRTRAPGSAALARRAARLLEHDGGSVEAVARRLGCTDRHLRRAFAENIGVPPKEFARAARLQRALRLSARSQPWSRVAVEAGYYDQAHLIADFRALVGLTPTAFAERARVCDPSPSAAVPAM